MRRAVWIFFLVSFCYQDVEAFTSPSSLCQSSFENYFNRKLEIRRTLSALNYKKDTGTSSEKDFYSVLGIGRTANEMEIKGAYRKLAKLYHPGKL